MTTIQIDRTDGLSSATAIKGPCRVATTANISLTGQQTIDGVAVGAGDRVLVKNQTTASENGIWVCDTGPWRRSKDFDGNRDVRKGTRVWVTDGNNGPAEYVVVTNNPIVIGTTALSIVLADSQITVVGTGTDFATKQLAAAFSPVEAPLYIHIMGYAAAGDGGAALYKKVASEPAHSGKFSITLANAVTVVWYEIAETVLRPEMFGQIGVNAAGDTAAWTALASVANTRTTAASFEASGQYLISGAIIFTGIARLTATLSGMVARQQTALSQTLRFNNCGVVRIFRGQFYGYAQKQIDASTPITEVNFDSGSYNGVAAIYAYDCDELWVDGMRGTNHAGGCITSFGAVKNVIQNCVIQGVGPTYNDPTGGAYPTYYPISGAHQGNGSDSAIYTLPIDTTLGWVQEDIIENNDIRWHSFGVRTVMTKRLQVHGNSFPYTPGQHHIYGTENEGISVVGNHYGYCRQIAVKMQMENYAGTIGKVYPAWQPSTAYAVGDKVVAFSAAYVCDTPHTSGASFTGAEWDVAYEYRRHGGLISANTFDGCGQAVGWIASSACDGLNIWTEGLAVIGNTILNGINEGIYLQRCIDATVVDNTILGGDVGIFAAFLSGMISRNIIRNTDKQAISASIATTSMIEGNNFDTCGASGANDTEKSPVLLYAPAATSIDPPTRDANPIVFFRDNGYVGTETFSGGWLMYDSDTRLVMHIANTYGSPTAKLMRVEGTIGDQFRNHYSGYHNSAQNELTFTLTGHSDDFTLNEGAATTAETANVLGTVIAVLAVKKIIKRA